MPSPCAGRVGPLMFSPPPPTTEVVVFFPISPRGGGLVLHHQPQYWGGGFFPPASAWGGGFCFACPSLGRWSAVVPDQASTPPAPVWGPVGFFFRQPQHGVVVFALLAPAWGGAALLCQTRQTVHQPQYGGRLVFFQPAPAWGGGALLCQTRQTAIGVAGVRSSRCALAATREGVEHPPNLRHTSWCQAPRWGGTRLAG